MQNHQLKAKCKQLDKGLKDKLPSRLCPQTEGGPFLTHIRHVMLLRVVTLCPALLYGELTFPLLGTFLHAGCSFAS